MPCCPECGEPPEELPRKDTEKIQRFRKLKASKKARIIYRCDQGKRACEGEGER
jgi:hypothetical protein